MDETITDTEEMVDPAALAARLAEEMPADIAEALNGQIPQVAAAVLQNMALETAVAVLDTPGLRDAGEIIEAIPRDRVVPMLSGMSADRAADVFRELDEPVRSELLARLDTETKASVRQLLVYPEESAGSLMTTEFVSVPATWTVAQTLQHVRMVERSRETVYAIYILDPRSKVLLRAMPLRRLITADANVSVMAAAPTRRPVTISPHASRDEATRLISKYDLLAVPVVDGTGQLVGIVTVDDVIDALVERQTEEVQRFGGMEAIDEPYMDIGFAQMIRKRAGWLCALFVSEMLTTSAMQGFQGELEKAIVLTLFIPLIMSSGGNSGSQATSLLIRALALRQLRLVDWWRVALRELPTGIMLGSLLGVIGIARIALWQVFGFYDYGPHWELVAATVGATLIGIVTFGSLVGSMLPFLLRAIGFDPAAASAPFVATLVDVTGLVIYFGVAALILRGTLL
jgi:magnesium transporter